MKIVIKDNDIDYKFQNLYVGSLSILNTSNQDYPEFSFGLTYDAENKFIQFQQQEIDRHHSSTFNEVPSLQNQLGQFDVAIKPFNRKDNYRFDFIVSINDRLYTAKQIKFSTSYPIKLKQVTTESELISLIPKGIEISLPFMKVLYTR
ncbi:MAG: hypothetical protein JWQ09_2636 [Segetibacter sp.]|nr:hypothetical protein [Segetibacter sp.]